MLDSEHMTEYALMNPYSPLSRTIYFDSLPGRLSPGSITSYDPLPSTLMAGQSGPLSSGTFGSSGYTFTETYSVTPDSPTNCLTVADIDPTSGQLHEVPGSPFPGGSNGYHCGLLLADASGPYIYSSSGPYVQVYSLDPTTGIPTEVASAGVGEQIVTSLAVTH